MKQASDASSISSQVLSTSASGPSVSDSSRETESDQVVVAGALAVDFSCDYAPFTAVANTEPLAHTSNPAIITQSLGGVAHNIAKAVHILGGSVCLYSAVGDDFSGRASLSQLQDEGMTTNGISILPSPTRTAQYVAVNNAHKDLAIAMADMSILETIPQSTISELAKQVLESPTTRPKVVVADANWSSDNLHIWLQSARQASITTIFEPVSTAKALRIFPSDLNDVFAQPLADVITPNDHELIALHKFAQEASYFEHPSWFKVIDALGIPPSGLRVPLAIATSSEIVDQGIPQQAIKLLPFFPIILTKLGPQGVLLVKMLEAGALELYDDAQRQYVLARNMTGEGIGGLYVRLYPPERVLAPEEIVSVNGIGDTFCGALAVGLASGIEVQNVVDFAQRAASLSLRSRESVSPELKTLKGEIAKLHV